MTYSESSLQKDCIKWTRASHKEVLVCNIHGGGWSIKGFPDLLLCINGRFVCCELKIGDNDLQIDQIIWRKRILTSGGRWYEIRSLTEYQGVIENELNQDRQIHNSTK